LFSSSFRTKGMGSISYSAHFSRYTSLKCCICLL
jgi:hypothetical protein